MIDEVALWKQRIIERKAKGQTIVDWCKEHNVTKGLDIYAYLNYLLTKMPNYHHLDLPDECRLNHKHKKCFNK